MHLPKCKTCGETLVVTMAGEMYKLHCPKGVPAAKMPSFATLEDAIEQMTLLDELSMSARGLDRLVN